MGEKLQQTVASGTVGEDGCQVYPVHALVSNREHTVDVFYNKENDPRPYIDVEVTQNQYCFSALVDTGAMVSVLCFRHEDELELLASKVMPSKVIISTMDGSEHRAHGCVFAQFAFANKIASVPIILVKAARLHLIAGMNFCKVFDIELAVRSTNSNPIQPSITTVEPVVTPVCTIESTTESSPLCVPEKMLLELLNAATTHTTKFVPPVNRKKISVRKRVRMEVNAIVTSSGKHDEINDVIPQKHTCVYKPHELSAEQQSRLDAVLKTVPYTATEGPLNCTQKYVQRIDTGEALPVMKKQYPLSPYIREEVFKEIDKLLERDIITEIDASSWRWPILWVRKPAGGGRICLDARGLNQLVVADTYPSMNADSILRDLKKAKYISSIDMTQAFHQIAIQEEDRIKTTFAVGNRLFCYKRATMGFKNSPADLTKLLDKIFNDLAPQVYHYVDDFIIMTPTFDEHIGVLEEVSKRLRDANLSVSAGKSKFCYQQVTFLGYLLSEDGLQPNPERIQPIVNYKKPETVRDVRRLVGLVNWYRRFIPNAAELMAPLTNIIRDEGPTSMKKIRWTDEAATAFESVKEVLSSEPIIAMADYDLPFKIYTDASLVAGSAILTQVQEGQERVIQYHSVKFSPTQQNYSATERELLAVLAGVERFRPWIDGRQVEVVTDHASIQWLHRMTNPNGKLARWAVRLQAFDIKFTHRPGKLMDLPDALSRAVELIEINETPPTSDTMVYQDESARKKGRNRSI